MRIVELSQKQFDEYAITHRYRSFYQTSQYGALMSTQGFKELYCALLTDDNRIIAASLLLVKKTLFNIKFAYAPRGFLVDYTNIEILNTFIKYMKEYLIKKDITFIKIDPTVIHIQRDKLGKPINNMQSNSNVISALKNLGFEHTGLNLYFENLKPRWNAIMYNCIDSNTTFNSFDKRTRSKIRNAKRKGIVIYRGSQDDIKTFYNLINKKHSRNLNYYYKMMNIFGRFNMFDIYFAKIDPAIYLKNSKAMYEVELLKNYNLNEKIKQNINNKKILNEKMESDKLLNMYRNEVQYSTDLLKNSKEDIIATCAIIKYADEILFLIDGIDEKYKNFNANYLLKWKIIEGYINIGYRKFNLNGIVGDFNKNNPYYQLNEFKSGFNPKTEEYIGEFNLILNKFKYNTLLKLNALAKYKKD